jgi:hypothetical protein
VPLEVKIWPLTPTVELTLIAILSSDREVVLTDILLPTLRTLVLTVVNTILAGSLSFDRVPVLILVALLANAIALVYALDDLISVYATELL